jgi:uncharacterized caspase-like protein
MNRKRFALVLGVNDYPADPQINPLVGAKADALAMYVFLLTQLRFDHVQLVQPEEAGNFLDAVEKSAGELGPSDLLLVYYAGHGFEVNHKHYLLTPNDRLNRLKADQGTMHKEVLVHAMRGRGCQRVLITDSCRSVLVGSRGLPSSRESVSADRDLGRREARESMGSLTLFDACDEGKTAAELKQQRSGLFTRSLLNIWEHRLVDSRPVTIDTQTQTDVALRMQQTAAELGMDGAQSPWLQNSGLQPVLFEGNEAAQSRDTGRAFTPAPAGASTGGYASPRPAAQPSSPQPPPPQWASPPPQPLPPFRPVRDLYQRWGEPTWWTRRSKRGRTAVIAVVIFWVLASRFISWGWHMLMFPWTHHFFR